MPRNDSALSETFFCLSYLFLKFDFVIFHSRGAPKFRGVGVDFRIPRELCRVSHALCSFRLEYQLSTSKGNIIELGSNTRVKALQRNRNFNSHQLSFPFVSRSRFKVVAGVIPSMPFTSPTKDMKREMTIPLYF